MNGRDQAPLVFVFSEPFTLALCCVLGGHLPSSRPVFRLRRPLPPLHALSCSWSSAELEAWIPDRNPASGNFAEAANDHSLPFWAFRVWLGLSVMEKSSSPLLILQRSLFCSTAGCNSPSPFSPPPKPATPMKCNVLPWIFFCLTQSIHSSIHSKQNQKVLHIRLPILGGDLMLGFLSQVCEFTSASTLPYSGSFLCSDLSGKQGYFGRNRYSLT